MIKNFLRRILFLNRRPVSTRDKIFASAVVLFFFVAIILGLLIFNSKQAQAPSDEEVQQRGFSYEPKTTSCVDDPQAFCDKVLRPEYSFSVVAPKDWMVSQLNSQTMKISKEGLDCPVTLTLGDNENYVSASGWLGILNPPGKKDPLVRLTTGEVRHLGVKQWPAAILTTNGEFENVKKEVYIPKGNIVFIFRSEVKGLIDANNNFAPSPIKPECEAGLNTLLNTVQL